MPQEDVSASTPETEEMIPQLEEEVAAFTAMRDETLEAINKLMAEESRENGVNHAQAIFELRQKKMQMEVEVKLRQNKINRIRLGIPPGGAKPPKDGFAF